MSRMGNGGPPSHANARQNREEDQQGVTDSNEDSTGDTPPPASDDSDASGGSERFFSYNENGVSYTVRVYQEDGVVKADITVDEGSMDVNAIYIADDDFDGPSDGLGGPLNMNGGGSQFEGEQIQWDEAIFVSNPGLGPQGSDKPSFVGEGETLTVDLTGISSVDDVDFFGIRATSVNGGDSIKAVSGNPDIVDEPPGDDDDNGGDDPDTPGCPDVISTWGEGEINHLVLHYLDEDENVFNVKVDMEGFQEFGRGLTDDDFADCLADLNSYLQSKEIDGIAPPACLAGLTVIGAGEDPETLFFELNGSELAAGDVDTSLVDYDLLEEDGQTFWNFDFAVQFLTIDPVDSSDCGCNSDMDSDEHQEVYA